MGEQTADHAVGTTGPEGPRLTWERHFTQPDRAPEEQVQWTRRPVHLTGVGGQVIFQQEEVEVPQRWSQQATNIVASRFLGQLPEGERETVRQMTQRVVGTLCQEGETKGYFASPADGETFGAELTYLLLHQMACFSGPVMAHLGSTARPTATCFINAVEDTMDSILELAQREAHLLKAGCSSGTNFSPLRASDEPLSGGGVASGPVSFMRGLDAFAGVLRRGGRTQSGAKLALLDDDHPDWLEFLQCKVKESAKARALVEAGYPPGPRGPAYESLFFQNTRTGFRLSDALIQAAGEGGDWIPRNRGDGPPREATEAAHILDQLARSVQAHGEPQVQFADTIKRWHTCPQAGAINASTPCGEFLFLDQSACNLSTVNVFRFVGPTGALDLGALVHTVRLLVTAQDILVEAAQYPTDAIAANSRRYRPLGLGFTNLAGLLRSLNLPYESPEGRALAAALTALITGAAYAQSARLARACGPFAENLYRDDVLRVVRRHVDALEGIPSLPGQAELVQQARQEWDDAKEGIYAWGLRNAQLTALSATATASFLLDSECPGIEPGSEGPNEPVPEEQLLLVAALQPLVSGGISKTILLPAATSVETIKELILRAHQLGVKTVSFKRIGGERAASRGDRPATTPPAPADAATPHRRRLPDERESLTHKFTIAGHKGYLTVGMYADGSPGEIFIRMAKAGSVVAGLMDSIGLAVSLALQYGVPLQVLVDKYAHSRFEPSGFTSNREIPMAKSIMDYLFRWLELRFLASPTEGEAGPTPPDLPDN